MAGEQVSDRFVQDDGVCQCVAVTKPSLLPLSKAHWQALGWARLGGQFQHPHKMCPHLTALPKFCSVANTPAFFFPLFFQKFHIVCIWQKLSPDEQSCWPQVFQAREIWDVSLEINASRGHAKIRSRGKTKFRMFSMSEELSKTLLVHNSCACGTL